MTKPTYVAGDVPTATEFNEFLVNVTFAQKGSDESVTSSTTLQDDDQLAVPVVAGATYVVEIMLRYDGSAVATNGDLKFLLLGTAGTNFYGTVWRLGTGAADTSNDVVEFTDMTSAIGCGTIGVGGTNVVTVVVRGTMSVGSAGTAKVQWAQVTSNGTATRVLTGSYIDLRRVS